MKTQTVAVVLVNWNGIVDTLRCLTSLQFLDNEKGIEIKIIVVDNASADASASVISAKFPNVELILEKKNLGFAGGSNVGIRAALSQGARYVWLLNNDTVVHRGALSLLRAMSDPSAGVAGSKIYFAAGHEYHRNRYRESERGNVIWYAGGIIDWKNMYASHRGVDEVDHGQFDTSEETQFITGCSMMVKREVFERVGLFDEKFYMYLEDVDFCLRAVEKGYTLLYVPQSIVWHKNAGSSSVGSELHQYYMTRNRLLVGMRYAPVRTKFALAREAIRFMVIGPSIGRKAVMDAVVGKWGKA
ncbi:glycosyltransferase family 2 protein [Candidatus Gottesmanbacteria bacterium]|nr:glycosyltransferase family 2 protein [Candidatus Gottesmanbacteria bacterium]